MKYGTYKVVTGYGPEPCFETAIEAHEAARRESLKVAGDIEVLKAGPRSGKYSVVARYNGGEEVY